MYVYIYIHISPIFNQLMLVSLITYIMYHSCLLVVSWLNPTMSRTLRCTSSHRWRRKPHEVLTPRTRGSARPEKVEGSVCYSDLMGFYSDLMGFYSDLMGY